MVEGEDVQVEGVVLGQFMYKTCPIVVCEPDVQNLKSLKKTEDTR